MSDERTDLKRGTGARRNYVAEGDTVWVRAKVVRGGGIGNVTLVRIADYCNKESADEAFVAVVPDTAIMAHWRKS